ncbi:MAG: hypothetical protein ACRERE_19450 [Candidatus Entotheonellia bacterium]
MNDTTRRKGTRRGAFLKGLWTGTLGSACLLMLLLEANAAPNVNCDKPRHPHPDCGVHNMMVIGEKTIFLSHLPMFQSEHRFQVIMEANVRKDGNSLDGVYAQDRASHSQTKMYTLAPKEIFLLAQVFPGDDRLPRRNTFQGTVFRGHLERGGSPIKGLTDIEVDLTRVVYARELQPDERKSAKLEYILFGRGPELFLAHRITQAPDFDHIVAVKIEAPGFTEAELHRGLMVMIPDRENSAAQRLKANEIVAAQGHVTGAHQFVPLQIEIGVEYYFEEGELSSPASMHQTPLEQAAGF